MNSISKAVGASMLAALVVALGVSYWNRGNVIETRTVVEKPVGGAEQQTEFTVINGIEHWYARQNLRKATTSPLCALRSPVHATSTGIRISVKSTGTTAQTHLATTSVPIQLGIYKDNSPTGTTSTAVLIDSLMELTPNFTNKQFTLVASSAPRAAANFDMPNTFSPGEWVVVALSNGAVGDTAHASQTFAPTGVCEAEWVVN